jgi:hypothetical protein
MNLTRLLPESRVSIQGKLRELTGRMIHVEQVNIFSFVCGCIGFSARISGLEREDVEVFKEYITKQFEEISEALNIKPEVVYASIIPGTEEVLNISSRKLCDSCLDDYSRVEHAPWGDVYVLKNPGL